MAGEPMTDAAWLASITDIVLGAVLLIIVLNVLGWLVFRFWPRFFLSENEKLREQYFARFETDLKPFRAEWFDINPEQWDDFARECGDMLNHGIHVYEPFVEVRHPPRRGEFCNFHQARFRFVKDQGPWPPSRDAITIFFFGGSTTLNVGPDWTSIPSRLQEELRSLKSTPRINVYNFGCGAIFSTQERILFQQILHDGVFPDVVVFLDGLNEFYFFDGQPAIGGFFRAALDKENAQSWEYRENRLTARIKWGKITEFVESLPMMRVIEAFADRWAKRGATAEQALYRPIAVDSDQMMPALDRYLHNKAQIEAICATYGIQPIFAWQPVPGYKYDLSHHIALNIHYGLGGHERSGAAYPKVAELFEQGAFGDNFIWLADLQEGLNEPLYVDSVHYTDRFSRKIAVHLAQEIIARGLLPASGGRASAPFVQRVVMTDAEPDEISDGSNLLTGGGIADLELTEVTSEAWRGDVPVPGLPAVRISSTVTTSEHFAVLRWSSPRSGRHTFSVYIRRDPESAIRLQLHDDAGNAAIVDVRVDGGVFKIIPIGAARDVDLNIGEYSKGWCRLCLTARLPGSQGCIFLQPVRADWTTHYGEPITRIVIQGPMLETGARASSYAAPRPVAETA